MELLILAGVAAFFVKNAAVDTMAMATGKTPPSHSYRMAKLRAEQAQQRRKERADPDMRGGLKMVARHWYLDACEDLDHWRAHRHATKPQRKAAARQRRAERVRRMREWAAQYVPEDEGILDAEIVDEYEEPAAEQGPEQGPGPAPDQEPGPEPGPRKRGRRRRTTTTEETEEEVVGQDLVPASVDQEQGEQAPLPHRRMVLATLIADAGHTPDWQAIAQLDSRAVDEAIAAVLAHQRLARA